MAEDQALPAADELRSRTPSLLVEPGDATVVAPMPGLLLRYTVDAGPAGRCRGRGGGA